MVPRVFLRFCKRFVMLLQEVCDASATVIEVPQGVSAKNLQWLLMLHEGSVMVLQQELWRGLPEICNRSMRGLWDVYEGCVRTSQRVIDGSARVVEVLWGVCNGYSGFVMVLQGLLRFHKGSMMVPQCLLRGFCKGSAMVIEATWGVCNGSAARVMEGSARGLQEVHEGSVRCIRGVCESFTKGHWWFCKGCWGPVRGLQWLLRFCEGSKGLLRFHKGSMRVLQCLLRGFCKVSVMVIGATWGVCNGFAARVMEDLPEVCKRSTRGLWGVYESFTKGLWWFCKSCWGSVRGPQWLLRFCDRSARVIKVPRGFCIDSVRGLWWLLRFYKGPTRNHENFS